MITEDKLQHRLMFIGETTDFLVVFKNENGGDIMGSYIPEHKVIIVYLYDENGDKYSDDEIIDTGIHELAHHLHYKKGKVLKSHGAEFTQIYNKLKILYEAFYIKRRCRLNESGSKKKKY